MQLQEATGGVTFRSYALEHHSFFFVFSLHRALRTYDAPRLNQDRLPEESMVQPFADEESAATLAGKHYVERE